MHVILALLLAQEKLEYRFPKDAQQDVAVEHTFEIRMTGNEQTIDYFRSAAAFLSFEKIRLRGDGSFRIAGRDKHKIEYSEARVDGRYDDEDYEYDFSKAAPPTDLEKDKLKQMLFFIFAGGKEYQLTSAGEYTSLDPNQDATGEVLDLFTQGIVRMPAKAVAARDTWEHKIITKREQKDNKGKFELVQKCTVEKIEAGKATIACTWSGKLVLPKDAPVDPNVLKTENSAEGKATVVIDVKKGVPVSWESSGKVRFYYRASDPNGGDDHEIDLTLTVSSKVAPR
jgi:hypothetical protein